MYGQFRLIAGIQELVIDFPENVTLWEIVACLVSKYPEMSSYLDIYDEQKTFANAMFLSDDIPVWSYAETLHPHQTISILPSATGG